MAKKTNNIFSSQYPSGIAFVGAIILGVAVGMMKNEAGSYTLMGVGTGFIFAAIISTFTKNRFLDR